MTDNIGVEVVQANAVFFAFCHAVELFPQGQIVNVVKIQASDIVNAVLCVWVGPQKRTQPLPQDQQIGTADLMLDLMSELHDLDLSSRCAKASFPMPLHPFGRLHKRTAAYESIDIVA